MVAVSRRSLLSVGAALAVGGFAPLARGDERLKRKFSMDLVCGSLGVKADQRQAFDYAKTHGFETVAADAGYLAALSDGDLEKLKAEMRQANVAFGAAGLPVDFRRDETTFRDGMRGFVKAAAGLKRAGVTRMGTWLRPAHEELTYVANFRQHVRRLREVASVLADYDVRFGLEYVGPKTSWTAARHSFIHCMAETKELIAEIGLGNVGFVLDSWHWYTAHETEADLLTLSNRDVVACDLNDAPIGLEVDQQMDLSRELPSATGVIDLKTFLNALVKIGYDGPVRAEPFNAPLREMPPERAVATTAAAMKKAFMLVE